MWGEIHKSTNMIALYHFDEASGTSHSDAMDNYDLTSGSEVAAGNITSKKGKSIRTLPPNNSSTQGTLYTTVSDLQIFYQDIENVRTFGVWCYPLYSNSVYRSYSESLIATESYASRSPFAVYKRGNWISGSPGYLEDTFRFSFSLDVWKANGTLDFIGGYSSQIYPYNKPYFLMVVFKPSDTGTNNGYIDFYVNFVKVSTQSDTGTVDTAWRLLKSYSRDRYLYISAPNSSPNGNLIFRGYIDEVFLSKDVFTEVQINNMNTDWKNSYIIT